METLTPAQTEILRPDSDAAMQIERVSVAYRPKDGAPHTEYTGGGSVIINGGEVGGEDDLGTFEIDGVSLPVAAKFTLENAPQPYDRKASPVSEFAVVDVRKLGLLDSVASTATGSTVGGFKYAMKNGRGGGRRVDDESSPQFALVNVTALQRLNREGGSGLRSINTISRDPKRPTMIRREHVPRGEAAVDTAVVGGLREESDIFITNDADGRIVVSMAPQAKGSIKIEAANMPVETQEPSPAEVEANLRAERLRKERKMLGDLALNGVRAPRVFWRDLADDLSYRDRSDNLGFDGMNSTGNYDFSSTTGETAAGATSSASTPESTAATDGPLRTVEDVYGRIAALRQAGVPDKTIKRDLLGKVHPDRNPEVNPDLAKAVSDAFRPQPQEYRNGDNPQTGQPSKPTPESAQASGPSEASAGGTESVVTPSAEVVPVSVSTTPPQATASDYAKAA